MSDEKHPQQMRDDPGERVKERLDHEREAASRVLHDARDRIGSKVEGYAEEAKERIGREASAAQRGVGDSIAAFGEAVRAAGDRLSQSDQGAASKLAGEAASGLERLSGAIKERPLQDIVDEVRSFGRQNAGALFAGSVLAGMAVGRLLKSSRQPAYDQPDHAERSAAGRGPDQGTWPGSVTPDPSPPMTPSRAPQGGAASDRENAGTDFTGGRTLP